MAKLIQLKAESENAYPKMWLPVGSIYENINDLTIAQLNEFLHGTWERWVDSKGRVIVGVDESQTAFSVGGKKGGDYEKTTSSGIGDSYLTLRGDYYPLVSADHKHIVNVVQPYVTTYKWIRIA